jgi:hypothetical protein
MATQKRGKLMETKNERSIVTIPLDAVKKSKPPSKNRDRKAKLSSCSVVPISFGKEISQRVLIDERIAHQKALRAYEDWQEQVYAIREAIEQGAPVEDGIWRAQVVLETVESHATGFPVKITKLVVW